MSRLWWTPILSILGREISGVGEPRRRRLDQGCDIGVGGYRGHRWLPRIEDDPKQLADPQETDTHLAFLRRQARNACQSRTDGAEEEQGE
jgi:hypothetical protein